MSYVAHLKKKMKEERKTFGPFGEFLVWYLRDAFSCHRESYWSLSYIACPRYPYIRVYQLYNSTDVQLYHNAKTIFQNLKNDKLISLYNIFECFKTKIAPSGAKVHYESTKLESCQTAKMWECSSFFLVLLLLPTGYSSQLHDPLMIVCAQNSSTYTEQCTSPLLFYNIKWQLHSR